MSITHGGIALVILLLVSATVHAHAACRSTYCTTCARDSHGRIKRSTSARTRFLKSKGLKTTPKGCQVDHIKPLAKGGKDTSANMQLLCGDALKAKESSERR